MKTDELREKYLEFFETKGCVRRPSDVLVPNWDPSVLFTPAGMNQFKDHFLGKVKLDFTRATTCQKCLRTGDIDNVGRTPYHHTFFEMLGNFSFGDYFKNEAIAWAWEFLTKKKWLGLEAARLSVTVYKDDDEAYGIWRDDIGLEDARIVRMDEDENFWPASAPSQGPDGVCGPCSEIYYKTDDGGEVEIWNLVFTQFNRVGDPPDNLQPLPSKNIDTGMGLERTASVLQKVSTNYHIDHLRPIVDAAAEVTGVRYEPESDNGRRLRRITDHARASVFAIHENTYPGRDKARYVIRRLIRRAVLDGHQMGLSEPFLYQLTEAVAASAASVYPELAETTARVADAIEAEEKAFFGTIEGGMRRIETLFGEMRQGNKVTVPGDEAADLNTTYGVPPELLQTLAAENGLSFDWAGYQAAMDKHAQDSGAGQVELFQTGPLESLKEALRETPFVGYEQTSCEATVKGLITGDGKQRGDTGQLLSEVKGPSKVAMRIVLDQSPFYGESGGQVGDVGTIRGKKFTFDVQDTQRHGDLIVHVGKLTKGSIHEGDSCEATVDEDRRDALCRAHTATHLLHHALHQHVGTHAQQQGSRVEPDRLRFDFTNPKPIDEQTLLKIERSVMANIRSGDSVSWDTVPIAEARKSGAMMLFGEKYPDPCRMVTVGDYSRELCGGTHASATGSIEAFELVSETNVSAGTRRIEALTGDRAVAQRDATQDMVNELANLLRCEPNHVGEAAEALIEEVRSLKKDVASGKSPKHADSFQSPATTPVDVSDHVIARDVIRRIGRRLNVSQNDIVPRIEAILEDRKRLIAEVKRATKGGTLTADDLVRRGETVGDTLVVVAETPGAKPNMMRGWIDQIRKQTSGPTAVMLAAADNHKVLLVGGMSRELVDRGMNAGQWVGDAANVVGGGGGGRPDMAQAGGKNPAKLPEALEQARTQMRDALG